MAAYEVLLLNTAIPQIQAAQSGDTYVVPRDIAINASASITGNLGIGTPSPAQKLEVQSTGGATVLVSSSTTSGSTCAVQFKPGFSGVYGDQNISAINAELRISSSTVGGANAVTTFYRGSSEAARFDSSGNFGIGLGGSNPTQRLHVATAVGNAYMRVERANQSTGQVGLQIAGGTSSTEWFMYIPTSSNTLTWFGNSTNLMSLDTSGNLGIGITNPSAKLDLAAGAGAAVNAIRVRSVAGNANGFNIVTDSTTDNIYLNNFYNAAMLFGTNNTERARITSGGIFQVSSGGSVQVGGTAARATTAGTNRLDIFNGTAPVGTLTNGISIYSSSGEAYVMDAAGNATLFSPHDAETNEWIFKSKHTPTGKVLKIDVERLLKFVNDHFGLDAVHEFVEE